MPEAQLVKTFPTEKVSIITKVKTTALSDGHFIYNYIPGVLLTPFAAFIISVNAQCPGDKSINVLVCS